MVLCEYELQRERRIAENNRRLEEMGILQLTRKLASHVQQERHRAEKKLRAPRAPRDLVHAPKRKSSRLEGKPAKNYDESILLKADRSERLPRANNFDLHVASGVEVYTEEDKKLLGDYKKPWVLFKDGYDSQGNRIYDRVNGKTCHQCRQKTLGRHTSCSKCNTLHGVFCGDCLFMRYGENILEVEELDEWVCPPCRGICNCSFHRTRKGWAPTGPMYRTALSKDYKSVAHLLVLGLQEAEVAAAAEAPAQAEAAVEPCAADCPKTKEGATKAQAVDAPMKLTTTGRSAILRQSHIDNVLAKSKHSASKAAKAKAGAKKHAKEAAVQAVGLGRLTRSAKGPLLAKTPVTRSALAVAGTRPRVQKVVCASVSIPEPIWWKTKSSG